MQLPFFSASENALSLLQTKWRSILNPFLANPSNNANILTGISLANGTTVINHKLGEKLIGWRIIGINGAATIYDQQASNQNPQTTLILVSNAAVTISVEVF